MAHITNLYQANYTKKKNNNTMPYQSLTPEQFHTEIKKFHDNLQSALPAFPDQTSNDFIPFITRLILLTHDFNEFIDLHYEFSPQLFSRDTITFPLFTHTLLIFQATITKLDSYGPLPAVVIIPLNH
jgi:hypothetical protein